MNFSQLSEMTPSTPTMFTNEDDEILPDWNTIALLKNVKDRPPTPVVRFSLHINHSK